MIDEYEVLKITQEIEYLFRKFSFFLYLISEGCFICAGFEHQEMLSG
jgi:hypothetical protein